MRVSLAPLPTVSPLVPPPPPSAPHQISPSQVEILTRFDDGFIFIHMLHVNLLISICPPNLQVETPLRVALPAPALQTPLQAQATFVPALCTASAPNCQVKGFVRGAANLPAAFPFHLWLARLHLPLSRRLPSALPLPFLAAILLPFPRQRKPSQPRYIPHPQLCATSCAPKVLSRLARPS